MRDIHDIVLLDLIIEKFYYHYSPVVFDGVLRFFGEPRFIIGNNISDGHIKNEFSL